MIELPQKYIMRMRTLLGDEFEEFISCYNHESVRGLRINLLRGSIEDILPKLPWDLLPSEILDCGFVCPDTYSTCFGTHPYHMAGVYYIQEPSAMSVVSALEHAKVFDNDTKILDLCAAPGGKSTGIAAKMHGTLVSNEIVFARAKELAKNIERMGIPNCVVTSAAPQVFAEKLPEYFDVTVVDAPCSGEGMFRKSQQAIADWSETSVLACASRQSLILDSAAKTIKRGGILAYSTCTFETLENECVINSFLTQHKDFNIMFSERLYPHKCNGEGHFVCLMKRDGESNPHTKFESKSTPIECKELVAESFFNDLFQKKPTGTLYFIPQTDNVILCTQQMIRLALILPTISCGISVCTIKRARESYIEPAHALFMGVHGGVFKNAVSYNAQSEVLNAYLRGNEIDFSDSCMHGYCQITCDGFPLGFGKISQGKLKNKLPKGLRLMK